MRYEVLTSKPMDKLLTDLKITLSEIQFGVLYELDFKDKLKEKNIDFDMSYKILEVCNPALAKEALQLDLNAGYFLPCKIVMYENDLLTHVGLLKPTEMMMTMGNIALQPLAIKVEQLLIDAMKKASEL